MEQNEGQIWALLYAATAISAFRMRARAQCHRLQTRVVIVCEHVHARPLIRSGLAVGAFRWRVPKARIQLVFNRSKTHIKYHHKPKVRRQQLQ